MNTRPAPIPHTKMNEKSKSEGKTGTEKLLWVTTFGVLLLACVVVFVHGIRRVDPKDLQATIAKGLPHGANQQAVLRFLDDQHIPHTSYLREYRQIYARVGRSTIGMTPCHIHVWFNFDEHGKLTWYKVQEICDFLE